jgi:iron complex transport system substrate-binding protein
VQLKIFNSRKFKLVLFSIITTLIIIGCGLNNTPKNLTINSADITPQVRVISHAMGETKVPLHPKRIAVLGGLDNVLALGVKPIAATTLGDHNFQNYLKDLTTGIEKIGINGSPSLEKILYLKPDLILGFNWDANIYEQLSQIAPTVLVDGDTRNWKEWLTQFAAAVGETQKAEKLLQDYKSRIKSLRQQMGDDRLANTEVSLVNFWSNFTRIYMNTSFSGSILQDIGLPRPPYQNQDKNHENVSLELIPKMEGDAIFLLLGGHNESNLEKFLTHPLWSRLQAVQEKRVYPVLGDTWISAWGIIGANRVLDDLFKYLIEQK